MAPRLRSAARTSANDSSLARSDGTNEYGSRPASMKSSPPSAKKAAAQVGQSDNENDEESPLPGGEADETAAADTPSASKDDRGDDDRISLPASSFERAAHRASRQGKAAGPSSSSLLSSEYDSEDIIVAPPRHSTPNSGDTNNNTRRKPNSSSSDLSDLGATPEPEDPELVRLAGEERRRKLDLCECEGWCTCEKYKIFYGFAPRDNTSNAGSDRSSAHDDEASTGTKRKRTPDADLAAKKPRTSTTSTQDEASEDDSAFLNSSQSKTTSDSNNRSQDSTELSDSDLPSQTHLSERVLANEKLPESSMRSTISHGKRRNAFDDDDDESAAKKTRTEHVSSWDRGDKPMRPPHGWVGGEWIGGRGKGKGKGKARMV
jgi:hypothetical protein